MERRDDAGFTLVELLVGIVLVAVLGSLVLTALVQGFQLSAQTTARVERTTDLQRLHERMSRDIRAADPIVRADATSITVQVETDVDAAGIPQTTRQVTYRVTGTTVEEVRGGAAAVVIADGLPTGSQPFTYFDRAGAQVAPPAGGLLSGTEAGQSVHQVRISLTLQAADGEDPITMTTSVFPRNREL